MNLVSPGIIVKKRLLLVLGGVALIFFALVIRIGWIQLFKGVGLQKMALDQWTRDLPVSPKRGMILDCNGKVLVQSASAETVIIRPGQIKDPQDLADRLSKILAMDRNEILEKALNKKKSEIWLKRQITKEQANQIRMLNLKGVFFTEDKKRYYPMTNFLSQVLGFTSIDGLGQEGIEAWYDKYLKGIPGRIISETDVKGNEMPYNVNQYVAPQDGYNVILTIDYIIQSFVEKAMNDAIVKNKAKKVEAIVMDPKTGAIFAISNKPDYDPNNPPRDNIKLLQELVRNPVISDVYEPGSTFKIVTSAAGLDAGVVTPSSTFFDPGYKIVDGIKIRCWSIHGAQTFIQGVQNSCNTVFMEIADRLGKEKFYQYIKNFGFGDVTGIDFNGEERGLVIPVKYVKNVDLARISFGQTIAVTPLQLITASSAAINGGNMMVPYLTKELKSIDNKSIKQFSPIVKRKVISETTSKTMRDILESVVRDGSGRNAFIPGYRVGGKTGTAQKYENGKIKQNKHVSSFIGFAPADDPKIIVLVIIDEPNVPMDFGSVIAAPYVKQILEDTLQYMGIQPQYDGKEKAELEKQVAVPDVIGKELQLASNELGKAGLQYLVEGSGGKVVDQLPKPGAKVLKKSIVILYLEEQNNDTQQDEKVEVPNIIGKSIVEVNAIIASYGLQLKINGNGVAVSQQPKAGEKVNPNTTIQVEFKTPTSHE